VDVDVMKIKRLASSLRAALDSVPRGQEAMAGSSLADKFNILRDEVLKSLPPELSDEFAALHPPLATRSIRDDPMASAQSVNEARVAMGTLHGWLLGVIEVEND